MIRPRTADCGLRTHTGGALRCRHHRFIPSVHPLAPPQSSDRVLRRGCSATPEGGSHATGHRQIQDKHSSALCAEPGAHHVAITQHLRSCDVRRSSTRTGRNAFPQGICQLVDVDRLTEPRCRDDADWKACEAPEHGVHEIVKLRPAQNRPRDCSRPYSVLRHQLVPVVRIWHAVDADDRDEDNVSHTRGTCGSEQAVGAGDVTAPSVAPRIAGRMDDRIDPVRRRFEPVTGRQIGDHPFGSSCCRVRAPTHRPYGVSRRCRPVEHTPAEYPRCASDQD